MASPLKRPGTRRKVAYFAAILGLFTVGIFWRGVVEVPLSGGVGGWVNERSVVSQAKALELREKDRRKANVTDAFVRLAMTGSRGLVTTILWRQAIEQKKKHRWDELEVTVETLTTVQPYFTRPWLFQSWNLSYNVAVESDRLDDMYYYIARGIQLLAEGDTANTENPDIRYNNGFYFANKFGAAADKRATLRCLFQLSCIPPADREYKDFLIEGDAVTDANIDMKKFEEFCRLHPRLIRRLRQSNVRADRPYKVVQFLKDNRGVPSRFDEAGAVNEDRLEQFPTPPPGFYDADYVPFRDLLEPFAEGSGPGKVNDLFDPYLAARSWHQYSLLPVPEPTGVPEGQPDRGDAPPGKRIPRSPALALFRQQTCLDQTKHAELLAEEGWFDGSGWLVDPESSLGRDAWFPGRRVVIGGADARRLSEGRDPVRVLGSGAAWVEAEKVWREHGRVNGYLLSPTKQGEMLRRSLKLERYVDIARRDRPMRVPAPVRDDPELFDIFKNDYMPLVNLDSNRDMTKYDVFLLQAEAEKDELMVAGRKALKEARRMHARQQFRRAKALYESAAVSWKKGLMANYRYFDLDRGAGDELTEYTYMHNMRYVRCLKKLYADEYKPAYHAKLGAGQRVMAAISGVPLAGLSSIDLLRREDARFRDAMMFRPDGPFDGNDSKGKPWVPLQVQRELLERYGEVKRRPVPADMPNPDQPRPRG